MERRTLISSFQDSILFQSSRSSASGFLGSCCEICLAMALRPLVLVEFVRVDLMRENVLLVAYVVNANVSAWNHQTRRQQVITRISIGKNGNWQHGQVGHILNLLHRLIDGK